MNVHLPVEQPLFLHLSFGLEINHWSFSIDKRSIWRRQEVLQNKYASHLLFLLFRYRAELLISVIMVLHIKRLYLKALIFFKSIIEKNVKNHSSTSMIWECLLSLPCSVLRCSEHRHLLVLA